MALNMAWVWLPELRIPVRVRMMIRTLISPPAIIIGITGIMHSWIAFIML